MASTGHVIGWTYYSSEHRMTYEVLDRATLWVLAPHGAVRVRWANGNETVMTRPADLDRVAATGSLVA
jgi:hypothetical protein